MNDIYKAVQVSLYESPVGVVFPFRSDIGILPASAITGFKMAQFAWRLSAAH